MKQYPSITKDVRQDTYIYAFDKLDGSNIRAEWNYKKGFYKFGSRTQLIDSSNKPLGKSINLIQEKYSDDLTRIFKEQRYQDALCFFEFYGPSSFAGLHSENEDQTVILLDVNPYKQGIMEPEQFINLFGSLDIPKVLYQGNVTAELFDSVKQSTLKDMTLEGIVCKGTNDKKTKMPIMFKVKSNKWLNLLKEHCKGDESLFTKLA
jgi:hypothetical protein